MLQKLRSNKEGFTLIELMIVIAIIGILAAIAIPNFIAYRNKAYCSQAESDAQNALAALSSYFSEPDRTGLPGAGDLATYENFTSNNGSSNIAISGDPNGTISVAVTDASGRCPRGGTYTATMGGDDGTWN